MNLLDVLEGNDWSIQQAIQTTFPFDPQFYSGYARPRLQKRNCELPLVLIDRGRYERDITSSDWREAPIGTDYLLEPVDTMGVFHPKINLFASERSVFYSISSANLTLEEYCKAAQIGHANGFQKNSLSDDVDDSYFLAKDVRDFYLDLLTQDGLITGRDARTYVTETAETLDWLDDISYDTINGGSGRRTWFLSNLSEPILSQALALLDQFDGRNDITCVRLYAPYYGTPNVVRRLATRLDADRVELLVEPESTALDVLGLPDALKDIPYTIRRMDARRSTRWVHAKFIVLEGPWGEACLYGSPNMTSSALLEGASGGNVEAGLFTVIPDGSSRALDDAVFDSPAFQFDVSDPVDNPESLDLRTTSYEGWESMNRREGSDIQLADARLTQPGSEGESELILTLSGVNGDTELTVHTHEGEAEHVVTNLDESDAEVSVYLSATDREAWTGAVVTVEVDGLSSNPRRVVEEMQAYYREYREITKSGGTRSSNTLLREILQNPDTAAINVFDIALSELQKSVHRADDGRTSSTDDGEESFPERSPTNLTSTGGSLPSLHSLVNQQLRHHREQAVATLDLVDPPQPSDIQQFIEHAETFWETIELCFALDRLGQLNTDQVNSKRLFSSCESQIAAWLESTPIIVQRLNGVIDQAENNTRVREAFLGSSDTEISELGMWKTVSDILFLHPGIVLEFDHDSENSAIRSRNGLSSHIVAIFRDVNPPIAQHVLNGETLIQRVETLLENLSVELTTSDNDLSLSGVGIQALILYILVQRTSDEAFFEALKSHRQFSGSAASELAQFALQADEAIVSYGIVSSVQWSIVLEPHRTKIAELI